MLTKIPLDLAAVALAATLAIIAVMQRPSLGLVLVAAAIPWGRLVAMPLPGIGLVDVLVGLTLFAWLLRGLSQQRIDFRPPPLTWSLLAFVWVTGLSLTQAFSWGEGAPEWLKWAEFAALYLVAAQMLGRRNNKAIIVALFAAGVSQAALGAYQFLGQVGPEAFILSDRFMRAYGTFQQPNPYAGYLGYLAPVAASLAITVSVRWWGQRRPADLVIALACAGITAALVAGILMSWSRGAWLGLAASLVAVLGLRNRRTAAVTLSATLLLMLLISVTGTGWLPNDVTARFSDLITLPGPDIARTEITDANFSVLERLAHWQAGLQMFQDHPWLGVGIGNYAVVYPAYTLPHWYEPLGHAHNVFVNFLAETGVLGLATFVIFWLGVGWLAWQRARRGGSFQRALALGILGTWIYLNVHSLFDNLFVQHIQLQLALLLAALTAEADILS